MNLENYKILKLSNKEMIVCEVSGETKDNYEISNPLKMDIVSKLNSVGQINEILNLRPWLQHFSEQRYFEVQKSQCILVANASVGLRLNHSECRLVRRRCRPSATGGETFRAAASSQSRPTLFPTR